MDENIDDDVGQIEEPGEASGEHSRESARQAVEHDSPGAPRTHVGGGGGVHGHTRRLLLYGTAPQVPTSWPQKQAPSEESTGSALNAPPALRV